MPNNRQNVSDKKWLPVAHSNPYKSHRKKIISSMYPGDCLKGLPVIPSIFFNIPLLPSKKCDGLVTETPSEPAITPLK